VVNYELLKLELQYNQVKCEMLCTLDSALQNSLKIKHQELFVGQMLVLLQKRPLICLSERDTLQIFYLEIQKLLALHEILKSLVDFFSKLEIRKFQELRSQARPFEQRF